MYILKQIFSLLKVLNSETGEKQIALGIACGLILGFSPSLSLQSIFIFILLLLFKIQMGSAFVSAFFFAFIAWVLDPLFHTVGSHVLEMEGLQGLFTTMYNLPIVPFTKFNNSVVMGSGIIAFLLFPVTYFLSVKLIIKYREVIVARFQNSKFWKAVKATKFYSWYMKYEERFG